MFPLGIAARKGPQGREASLRHTKSRSRPTWRIPREFLLRMGVGRAGFGSSAGNVAGRLRAGTKRAVGRCRRTHVAVDPAVLRSAKAHGRAHAGNLDDRRRRGDDQLPGGAVRPPGWSTASLAYFRRRRDPRPPRRGQYSHAARADPAGRPVQPARGHRRDRHQRSRPRPISGSRATPHG